MSFCCLALLSTRRSMNLRTFADLYGRDAPVLAALDAPRVANRAHKSSEKVVQIIDDLQ